MSDKPRFLLTLQAEPSEVPPVIRLRRVLKSLLRAYGFKCLAAVELKAANGPPAATDAAEAILDAPEASA